MDRDARTRARLEQHWEASERGDIDAEHAIYADDAVLEPLWPRPEPSVSGSPG